MPRIARIVVPGVMHHVTQRGNNRRRVFLTRDDYRAYLAFPKEESERCGLKVAGNCLMPNHVHLVALPPEPDSLAKAIGRTHFRYAQHFNRVHARSGHLWQNRFYSCALDEAHLILALRYVERNPVRAGIVRAAWEYPWSSARAHVGGTDESSVLDLENWSEQWSGPDWMEFLKEPDDDDKRLSLRSGTHTGRPVGDEDFLNRLEKLLGCRLRPLPVGRPPKDGAREERT